MLDVYVGEMRLERGTVPRPAVEGPLELIDDPLDLRQSLPPLPMEEGRSLSCSKKLVLSNSVQLGTSRIALCGASRYGGK